MKGKKERNNPCCGVFTLECTSVLSVLFSFQSFTSVFSRPPPPTALSLRRQKAGISSDSNKSCKDAADEFVVTLFP